MKKTFYSFMAFAAVAMTVPETDAHIFFPTAGSRFDTELKTDNCRYYSSSLFYWYNKDGFIRWTSCSAFGVDLNGSILNTKYEMRRYEGTPIRAVRSKN